MISAEFINWPGDILAVWPTVTIASFAVLHLLTGMFWGKVNRLFILSAACFTGIATSLLLSKATPAIFNTASGIDRLAFGGMVYGDAFAGVFNVIILSATFFAFLLNHKHLQAQGVRDSIDVDILMLLSACGAMLMVSAAHLLMLFVGLELLSIPLYVLAGLARNERASSEGAFKYFVLGAFSSAFLLFGITFIYGATGTMELDKIALGVTEPNPMLMMGIGMIIFGLGFKISLVPFHFWTPDVYQGAPTSLVGFMAVVVKAAAFGSMLRVFYTGFGAFQDSWIPAVWVVAALTMTLGNLFALRQRSLKRMFAYSSVAHAGYALMGLLALGEAGGVSAIVFYMFVYGFMSIASFGILVVMTAGTDAQYDNDDLESVRGMGWRHPLLGIAMTITVLSLAGIPPFGGFVGKFYLFYSVVRADFSGLVILAAINSVISLYYYLRVIVVMYFGESETGEDSVEKEDSLPSFALSLWPQVAIYSAVIGIVYLGIFSASAIEFAERAASSLG